MGHRFLEIASTPAVKAAQTANGSRAAYSRHEGGDAHHDRLGPGEAAFIAARDSFYMATASADGWPYIQHRGGPVGFLKVLDERTLGFADFRGNRQYISVGNASENDRVSLFLMDYPNQRRLKLLGRVQTVELAADTALAAQLATPGYKAVAERGLIVRVEAFDWNCPQHITPRFSPAELDEALDPVRRRLTALEAENAALRERLVNPSAKEIDP